MAKFYNRKVKSKFFSEGGLLWKVILPMDKKSKFYGKRSLYWEGPFEVERVHFDNAYSIKLIGSEQVFNVVTESI